MDHALDTHNHATESITITTIKHSFLNIFLVLDQMIAKAISYFRYCNGIVGVNVFIIPYAISMAGRIF
jgi:hypothetical protein